MIRPAMATTPKLSPATSPSAGVLMRRLALPAAIPAAANTTTAPISPRRKPSPTGSEPSLSAAAPSSPSPAHTTATAAHSLRPSRIPRNRAATAVTARLAASAACTTNSGRTCRAAICATNPSTSSERPATNFHWPRTRTSSFGSTPPVPVSSVAWAATDCITEATPYAIAAPRAQSSPHHMPITLFCRTRAVLSGHVEHEFEDAPVLAGPPGVGRAAPPAGLPAVPPRDGGEQARRSVGFAGRGRPVPDIAAVERAGRGEAPDGGRAVVAVDRGRGSGPAVAVGGIAGPELGPGPGRHAGFGRGGVQGRVGPVGEVAAPAGPGRPDAAAIGVHGPVGGGTRRAGDGAARGASGPAEGAGRRGGG